MAPSEKLDLYKQHKDDYTAPRKPVLVDIAPAQYLTIAGQGSPDGERFHASMEALYGIAFTIKMTRKFAGLGDYGICKLEGQWWTPEGDGSDYESVPKEQWCWRLLIRTPDFVEEGDLVQAREALLKKGKGKEVKEVKLENLHEGLCVQVLHIGPYDAERTTIEKMVELAESEGLTFQGRHHEIYLSDPRRTAPEKLRTILRHPVRKSS